MNLSIIELSVLLFCAISLGIVIHFFFVSRRNFKNTPFESEKLKKSIEQWKLRYFNDLERKENELAELKKQLHEAEENVSIYKAEIRELKRKPPVEVQPIAAESPKDEGNKPDYVQQLRLAQEGLAAHHQKIEQLIEVIDVISDTEEKEKLFEQEKQELESQVEELKYLLEQKDAEINALKQQQSVGKEMISMLDNAYSEFNSLQEKIYALETQLSTSKMANIEFEDQKETYFKVARDFEEQKLKLRAATIDNQQLRLQLNEVEDKLREANFQRQQLQKKLSYMEELNNDLQLVAAANKKLEHQLRRIGELESMLNVVSEERDELLKKQTNS